MGRITIRNKPSTKPVKATIDLDAAGLYYKGPYSITPSSTSQTFLTAGKVMSQNFKVGSGFQPDYYSGDYIVQAVTSQDIVLPTSQAFLSQDITIRSVVTNIYSGVVAQYSVSSVMRLGDIFPDAIKIAFGAFQNNSVIREIQTWPDIYDIGSYAFASCSLLTSMAEFPNAHWPNALPITIGQYAFQSTNLSEINFSTGRSYPINIKSLAFRFCKNLRSITIKNCNIDSAAFCYCSNLTYVSLNVCDYIQSHLFLGCESLSQVYLSANSHAYIIGSSAFQSLPNLEAIEIYSAKSIGLYAFANCPKLSEITVECETLLNSTVFLNDNAIEIVNLNFKGGDTQQMFQSRSLLRSVIFSGTTNIGNSCFQDCSLLSQVQLGEYMALGSYAFSGCNNLDLNYPSFVHRINRVGWQALPDIFPESYSGLINCEEIEWGAFTNYSTIKDISFEKCLKVGREAFNDCSMLTSISLPNCSFIGYKTFAYCSALSSITIPACRSVGSSAFYRCLALTNVSFPLCSYIGDYAFCMCSALTNVNFPVCSYIGSNAFAGCTSLASVYLLNSTSMCILLNSGAFSNTPIASGSGTIYVPENLYATYVFNSVWSWFESCISAYSSGS